MPIQPLQITGAALSVPKLIERNKVASGLDYVGYVPGLGSVAGVARLIGGIAVMIFYCIKASYAEGEKKENLLIWRTIAGHEALRGLCEITWLVNLALLCNADHEDSNTNPQRNGDLSDKDRARYLPIKGIIPRASWTAYGNYIYKDNSDQSEALHYSWKKYENNQVIWQSVLQAEFVSRPNEKFYVGTQGVVLKEGYAATQSAQDTSTFVVQKSDV